MPVNHAVQGKQPEEREEVWEGQVGERAKPKKEKRRQKKDTEREEISISL